MGIEDRLDSPLANAVRAAGGQSRFARLIGRSQPYVHGLLRDGKELPPKEAKLVDAAKIGVSKEDLCPDIFGRETPAAPIAGNAADYEHAR